MVVVSAPFKRKTYKNTNIQTHKQTYIQVVKQTMVVLVTYQNKYIFVRNPGNRNIAGIRMSAENSTFPNVGKHPLCLGRAVPIHQTNQRYPDNSNGCYD